MHDLHFAAEPAISELALPEHLWSRHEHRAAAAVADGCFSALAELLAPQHGAVRETAALALRPLAPGLLSSGTAGGAGKASGRGGASAGGRPGAAVRARILAFAEEALRYARS